MDQMRAKEFLDFVGDPYFSLRHVPHVWWSGPLAKFLPRRGLFALIKATGSRRIQQESIDALDLNAHRVRRADDVKDSSNLRIMFLTVGQSARVNVLMSTTQSTIRRLARGQAEYDQAIAACALERYYLEHHVYPDGLVALVPTFLSKVPTDLMTGTPMGYRRTPDDRYLLYSIGWNQRDDGVHVGWDVQGRSLNWLEGDWVWQYQELHSPNPPPARR